MYRDIKGVWQRCCFISSWESIQLPISRHSSSIHSTLPDENLYIIFDGEDQKIPDYCSKVNTIINKRIEGTVQRADKGRINLINAEANRLFSQGYEVVIGCDVDEFLIVDPKIEVPFATSFGQRVLRC